MEEAGDGHCPTGSERRNSPSKEATVNRCPFFRAVLTRPLPMDYPACDIIESETNQGSVSWRYAVSRARRVLLVVFVLETLLHTGQTLAQSLLPPVSQTGPDNGSSTIVALPIVYGGGKPTRRVVVCLGNSVTHGRPYIESENTYPARLHAMLASAYGPASFEVINHGVSGYRADQVLADLQALSWMDDDPAFVLLMVGGNDLAQETLIYGLSETIAHTVAEVQAIVDLVKAHVNADGSTPLIIVSAFIPNLILDYWGSDAVALYNAGLESSLTGIDLWTTDNWDDFYDPNTEQARVSLMYDLVHPNVEGYRIIAENWFEDIEALLPASTELVFSPEAPVVIMLRAGWNLVGCPMGTTMPIAEALASIEGSYDLVYAYDAGDTVGPWKKYSVLLPATANDRTAMRPDEGYWIRAGEDCTWAVP